MSGLQTIAARVPAETTPADLVEAFLDRRSEHTRRAYAADLRDFAEWLHLGSPAEAAAHLLSAGQAGANRLVFDYIRTLRRIGLSAGTANRRLAALKSLVKLGRMLGACNFRLDVERQRDEPYRDTRGPAVEKVREIIGDLERRADKGDLKATRDLAVVRLLFGQGLRCHEVVGLDVRHFDRKGGRLSILGKARARREWITCSPKTAAALHRWLAERWVQSGGRRAGPMFVSMVKTRFCPAGALKPSMRRLHREDLYRLLKPYGVRPHGLRHAAITAALEQTGGNIAAVQRFSRHASPQTVMRYEDNRQDAGGKVAEALDSLI